jgi:hypothetical protein
LSSFQCQERVHHNLNHVIQTKLAILVNRNHGSVIASSPSMDLDGQLAISGVAWRYGARLLRGRARVRAPSTPAIFHLPTYFISCTSPNPSLPCCSCFAYLLERNKDGSCEKKGLVTGVGWGVQVKATLNLNKKIERLYIHFTDKSVYKPRLPRSIRGATRKSYVCLKIRANDTSLNDRPGRVVRFR